MILQLLNYWRGNDTDSHQGEGCSLPPVRDIQNGEADVMKTRHCKAQEVRMPENIFIYWKFSVKDKITGYLCDRERWTLTVVRSNRLTIRHPFVFRSNA